MQGERKWKQFVACYNPCTSHFSDGRDNNDTTASDASSAIALLVGRLLCPRITVS